MGVIKELRSLVMAGHSTESYYKSMNQAFEKYYGQYLMLHYPFFGDHTDDLIQCQKNLTHYCISQLPGISSKKVLEIGCGNGIQSMFLLDNYDPHHITGIDINTSSISIANDEVKKRKLENITFLIDNSQELNHIEDNSMDIVVNIESAFHYPDKPKFISEVKRVLKPGGHFVIADIINRDMKEKRKMKKWKSGMSLHHWTDDEYIRTFSMHDLSLDAQNDITDMVINGFRTYRNWYQKFNSMNVFRNVAMRLFILINVKLNIHLLKTRRRYMVYTGLKVA